jgi:hypothetical protein
MVIGQKPLLFSETQMRNWLIRPIGGISHICQIKREWMWAKRAYNVVLNVKILIDPDMVKSA